MQKTSYTIGRESKDREFNIEKNSVSRQHALLTKVNQELWMVEDLNSSNGTFVNGNRIHKSALKKGDVLLVADVEINTEKLFENPQVVAEKVDNITDIKAAFEDLKIVYDTYIQAKLNVQKKGALTSAGLRAGLSIIPYVGNAIAILSSTKLDKTEKIMMLEEQLKIDYVCPKCKVWLGPIPWEALKNRGVCLTCKTEWLKPSKK